MGNGKYPARKIVCRKAESIWKWKIQQIKKENKQGRKRKAKALRNNSVGIFAFSSLDLEPQTGQKRGKASLCK